MEYICQSVSVPAALRVRRSPTVAGLQALSSDPAFVRLEKGVYALACLVPSAEPTARAPRSVKKVPPPSPQRCAMCMDPAAPPVREAFPHRRAARM